MPDNEQTKKGWTTFNVSRNAVIKRYDKHSFMKMPETSEYAGYTYNVYNSLIEEGRQLVDMESDGRELSYKIKFAPNTVVVIKNKDGDEKKFTAEEFKEIVGGTSNQDYVSIKDYDERTWYTMHVPKESIISEHEKSTRFIMPNRAMLKGYTFFLPNGFISENIESEDGGLNVSIPKDFDVIARSPDGEETKVSAYDLDAIMSGTDIEDYVYEEKENKQEPEEKQENKNWRYVSVSKKAILREKEDSTLFKMPNGTFNGYSYYIPNNLLKENEEKGTVRVALPDGFVVKAKNNRAEKEEEKLVEFTADNFVEQVKGKTDKDYESLIKPNEENTNPFLKVEENLVKNVPVEMKERPNWVAVKTWFNKDKGRYEKRPINCLNGEYAEADNPKSWTDFETARKFAKEKGYSTLAYALDGKDGICCIDLDGSVNEKGEYSALATEVLNKCGKTYIEKSLSGKGLHVFGSTSGMDVRTFAKDNSMEFYQKDHFVAVTGDGAGFQRFESFDRPDMKAIIERKCEKRQDLRGAGKGVEGLSKMTDRDVVEKAMKSKGGDTFKALYEGEDLQNNHSNSDMSLMNRLAFWCNGDKEQMLRIFATSGLYRPNKSSSYYEGTVVKAIRDTTQRFQPSQNISTAPKPVSGNSSGKGGK